MRKLYFRLGLLIGIIGADIGLSGLLFTLHRADEYHIIKLHLNVLCLACGLFVIYATAFSVRNPKLRYYSKLVQIALLYILAVIYLVHTGYSGGQLLFIVGLALAFRYSFLSRGAILWTFILNCVLIVVSSVIFRERISMVIDRLVFIGFVYLIIYLIYSEYNKFLKKRIKRLNRELDIARRIIPFGTELKKKLRVEAPAESDFTRKEYELMVAICVHEKLTNEELSDFLGISVATVKTHLNNIYRKTGIHNRSRLIAVYKDLFFERRDG